MTATGVCQSDLSTVDTFGFPLEINILTVGVYVLERFALR